MTKSKLFLKLAGAAFAFICLTSNCSSANSPPAAAWQAVEDQARATYARPYSPLESFDQAPQIKIVRAWRARDLAQGSGSSTEDSGMWCFDLAVSGQRHGFEVNERYIWIAVRDDNQPGWSTAALITLSSILPYERCGQVP